MSMDAKKMLFTLSFSLFASTVAAGTYDYETPPRTPRQNYAPATPTRTTPTRSTDYRVDVQELTPPQAAWQVVIPETKKSNCSRNLGIGCMSSGIGALIFVLIKIIL